MAKGKVLVEFSIVQKGKSFSIIQKETDKLTQSTNKAEKDTKKLTKAQSQNYSRQKQGVIQTANSTKNFSKLSQSVGGDGGGPGGLVRAYALLAANVFALTAAFGVLSRSAQIDTLNQSMEVLSTTGGSYIRNVAKEMQAASGFAVDLAQSFRQVSLAASAGLNTKEIEGLTMVAKGAAISLGRNLPDAMDRIFRGAIKLEPEILDEIGLFVRVDEAAQKYARNNGKVVSALTQVEKRQAFLNEILEQGTKKFQEYAEEIKPDAYVRLAAALGDIAQKGLSMLNKPLGSFLSMLAESKGLLTVVFGGLVLVLLKKAIPAMGLMTKTSAEAAATASASARDYTESIQTETSKQVQIQNDAHEKRIKQIESERKVFKKAKGPKSTAGGAPAADAELARSKAPDQKRYNALVAKEELLQKQINGSKAKNAALLRQDQVIIQKEIASLKDQLALEDKIADNKERGKAAVLASSNAGRKQAKLDQQAAVSTGIANAVGVAETQNLRMGATQLNNEIRKLRLGVDDMGVSTGKSFNMMQAGLMRAQGGVAIMTTGINKMMMMLGPWMMALAMAAAAVALIAKWLKINSAESKAFSEQLVKMEDHSKNLSKRFTSQVEGMQNTTRTFREMAKAAAAYNINQTETSKGILKLVDGFNLWQKTASSGAQWWESTIGKSYIPGMNKFQKTEAQVMATSFDQIAAAAASSDEVVLRSFENQGVALDEVRAKGLAYQDTLKTRIKMETQAGDVLKNLTASEKASVKALSSKLTIKDGRLKTSGTGNIKAEKTAYNALEPAIQAVVRARVVERIAMEKVTKASKNSKGELNDFIDGQRESTVSTEEKAKALKNLESAFAGGTEALGKYNAAFMPKTKVDDVLASFNQLGSSLSDLDKIDPGAADKYWAAFADPDNPFRGLFKKHLEPEFDKAGKQVGMIFKKGVDMGTIKEAFQEGKEDLEAYRKTIILAKSEIAAFSKEAKNYASISAGGLAVNTKQQRALLNIAKKNSEISKTELKNAYFTNNIDAEKMVALKQALALNEKIAVGHKDKVTREEILTTFHQTELTFLMLQGRELDNNSIKLKEQMKDATHILDARKQELQALQKVVSAQKAVTDATSAEFRIKMQLANLSSMGTTELNPRQEAQAAIEAAKAKYDSFIAETKIKFLLLDIEEKIVLARLRVLAAQDKTLKAEMDNIAASLTAATGANKSAIQKQMGNAAGTLRIELAAAVKAAFGADTFTGIQAATLANETLKNVNAEKIAEIAKRATDRNAAVELATAKMIADIKAGGGTIGKKGKETIGNFAEATAGKAFDDANPIIEPPATVGTKDMLEEARKADNASQMVREALTNSIETFKQYGPEGAFVSSVLGGGIAINDAFQNMTTVMNETEAGAGGSMERMAAGAQFASSAISAVGQIMAANSAKQIGEIDKQIAAEQKRDGKSAGSLAKIKAMEAKKEQMQKKAFNQNKKMQMAGVVASTAASIMQVWANPGDITKGWAIAMTAMIGGLGAAQLALISGTSYDGGGSGNVGANPTALTIGGQNNSVDVSKRASSGELSYMRGESGSGTGANDFRTGGATGIRGYAAGKKGYAAGGLMVGEQGPERIDVVPNEALNRSNGQTNVTFNVSAIDGASVQSMLQDQQGNIISMIQSAANDNGSQFLPEVDASVYGGG